MSYDTETAKYRDLTVPHCQGLGVDIGSQGDPVVPWAWNIDLSLSEFLYYNSNNPPRGPIQIPCHADAIPIGDASLDFVYSSHLLEDFADWNPILKEWVRLLKPGGKLIILIPERELWCAACAAGQPPNDAHRHEGKPGELSNYAEALGLDVIEDRLTNLFEGDYSILFIATKRKVDVAPEGEHNSGNVS